MARTRSGPLYKRPRVDNQFHRECLDGNIDVVRQKLSQDNVNTAFPFIFMKEYYAYSKNLSEDGIRNALPLNLAIMSKNEELVRLLLANGADTNGQSSYQFTSRCQGSETLQDANAMHFAIFTRNMDIARLLFAKADVCLLAFYKCTRSECDRQCVIERAFTPTEFAEYIGATDIAAMLRYVLFSKHVDYLHDVVIATVD
jgi:ankyrin repeat protein